LRTGGSTLPKVGVQPSANHIPTLLPQAGVKPKGRND
jgi:hypothetical protein